MSHTHLKKALPTLDDLLREEHRRSFYAFFKWAWHIIEPAVPFQEAEHIKAICNHAQAVVEGQITELSVEIGPGYGKSLSLAVALVPWLWGARNQPHMRLGYSTYESELTKRDSGRCRDLINHPEFQRLYGHTFKLIKEREDYLRNDKSGFRLATSVKGAATGHRFHMFIGDDLLNLRDAESESERNQMLNHLRAMSSRGVDMRDYKRIIIGQRLHEEDAGGWARERNFEVLCLPTEFDPSRACQTKIGFKDWRTERGELLFPQRFGAPEVEKAKVDLGPYGYSAQHQQLPVPVDGGIIKRAWFDKTYLPRKTTKYGFTFISVDTAFTDKKDNDTSALTVWGVFPRGIFLLDAISVREEMPELLKTIKDTTRKWKPAEVVIEAKANGLSIIQMLERADDFGSIIVPITPVLSKNQRAHAAAPFVAAGKCFLPIGEKITEDLLAQLAIFPAGKVRDLADSAVQAILHADATYTIGESVEPEYIGSSAKNAFSDED